MSLAPFPIAMFDLIALGFTEDHSAGHPVYKQVMPSEDDTSGCITSLHLLEDSEGGWIVELANQMTPDDPPTLVALPRVVHCHDDLHALWRVLTGTELLVE